MQKENLHEPFSIVFKTLDECPKLEHTHSFFELVYILSGTGEQCINKNRFRYQAGHMFLLTPDDCHSFDIATTTEFFFLRFNNIYIHSKSIHTDNVQRLEFILQHANHQPGCILRNLADKSLVKPMVEAIIREYVNRDIYNLELVQHLVNTLIVVVARNIARYLPEKVEEGTEEKALDILQYIQNNIYDPEKIRTEEISKRFGVSVSYLGRYFKRHTNETMQQYISNYRLKMVEHRLLHSDMRMSEIVDELGFTDESHLNKFFRKQKGLSPTAFRKARRQAAV
jgi:AraC-like DNA-binding protein